MRSGLKMKLWEAEQFLNQTSDLSRSLTDPWELDPVQDRDEWDQPTGTTHTLPFEPEVLLDTIMLKGGELGILFNNLATYYRMDRAWWRKWKPTFQRWWEVEEIHYNPMWDRDGLEKAHDDTTDTGYNNNNFSSKEVVDDDATQNVHTKTVTDTDTTDHSETLNSVSAYDAGNTLVTHDKSETDSNGTIDTTSDTTTTATATDDRTTTVSSDSDTDLGNDRDFDHLLRSVGQWGISTKSAEMYALQIKSRRQNNLYELMSDLFIKEMTDGVWV